MQCLKDTSGGESLDMVLASCWVVRGVDVGVAKTTGDGFRVAAIAVCFLAWPSGQLLLNSQLIPLLLLPLMHTVYFILWPLAKPRLRRGFFYGRPVVYGCRPAHKN